MTSAKNSDASAQGRISATQCRAARALLGWSQQDLAERARIGTSTVADFERGKRSPVEASVGAITVALESAGVQFLEEGVKGPSPTSPQNSILVSGTPLRLIDATDLTQWAARLDAKAFFPELIERLILATVGNLPNRIQFPSGDSVQQQGWDGICEQDGAKNLNWLPTGLSAWELGVQGGNLRAKADDDYEKRTKDSLGLPREATTFVFATSRRWKAGAQWARERCAEKIWKEVRVIDADDLSAWIALFPSVAYWLATRTGKYLPGSVPLEEYWREWRLSTEWPISTELVLGGRDRDAIELLKWLYDRPTVRSIQGDSAGEGIVFLYAAIDLLPEPYRKLFLSRCLVSPTPEAARSLGTSSSSLVIIIEAAEPGLASRLAELGHHVLVAHGSQVGTTGQVNLLSRPQFEPFQEALEKMGIPQVKANALARDSVRKLSVLRRLIPSTAGAIVPAWAERDDGRLLLPALLAGAWEEDHEGDRSILEELAGESFEDFSRRCPNWIKFPDAPLRHAGRTWKIASPYDAWFRLAGFLSKPDLDKFYKVAHAVLSAEDPRFDLNEEERWFAPVKGQLPKYSPWLTSGITETLLLLAMFGNQVRTVPDAAQYAERIVRALLGNADQRRWWSLSSELNTLAEVSPEAFMSAIELSLDKDDKPVMVLFKEDSGPVMGRAYHSHLLWGLETLAWSPDYLSQVTEILARLAALDPGGKYANRPKNSLRSIFLLWLPQTNATFAQRLKVIDRLRKVNPEAAWHLMLDIFPRGYDTSTYNPRPKWRDFEAAAPELITNRTIWEGTNALADRLLADADADSGRWKTLIEHLPGFPPDWRKKAWTHLEDLAASFDKDEQRLPIRDALRILVDHHRSFPDANWALPKDEVSAIEVTYQKFVPADLVLRCAWLFADNAPLLEGTPKTDWELREEQLSNHRKRAVSELIMGGGLDELKRLIGLVKRPFLVGAAFVQSATEEQATRAVREFVESESQSMQDFLHGVLAAGNFHHGWNWSSSLLSLAKSEHWSESPIVRVLLALPSEKKVWDLADALGNSVRTSYWKGVPFFLRHEGNNEVLYAIDQMIAAGRAAHVVEMIAGSTKDIPTKKIIEVLSAAATSSWPLRDNDAVMFQWGVGELLKALENDRTVEDQIVARLEWMYLAVLEHSERTPIVLHRFMASDPAFFVQVLSAVFRTHSESAPNHREATDQEKAMATQAFRLLNSWNTVPGSSQTGVDGEILASWVSEAHRLAVQAERGAIGDEFIGRVLSFAPTGGDGIWPHESVRSVIETMRNTHLENGISIGVFNQGGVTSRGMFDGGGLERGKAGKYDAWADATKLEWPRTSAVLREIARSFKNTARRFDEEAERTDWEY